MKYLPRNRVRGSYSKRALSLVTIFVVGALAFALFDNLIITAVSPLWRAENSFSRSLSTMGTFFKTRGTLIHENAALKERLASLELELSAFSLSRSENERLLELLGRQSEVGGVAATVLTHPPQSPYDLLVVDAGEKEALLVGAKAFLPEGPEVGVITQVSPNFSRVKLLSTSGEKTQAVLERHQVAVTLEGVGGGNFKIVLPREAQVEVGDRVLSADLQSSLLAVVEEVSLEATDSFKEVLARSPANIFTIRFLIIRP
ncbi:MAG: rod shape-determining protein MreC [Patescibacteria group bacterium]